MNLLLLYISLSKTITNKIVNYKETVSSIDNMTYGTGIVECDCQQHKGFVDENHGHVLKGDLRIITNFKLRKHVSKGPNFPEAMSTNWNICKREIEIGLDSKTNSFNNPQNNNRRVCRIEKKDSPKSWQKNHFSKIPKKSP